MHYGRPRHAENFTLISMAVVQRLEGYTGMADKAKEKIKKNFNDSEKILKILQRNNNNLTIRDIMEDPWDIILVKGYSGSAIGLVAMNNSKVYYEA